MLEKTQRIHTLDFFQQKIHAYVSTKKNQVKLVDK